MNRGAGALALAVLLTLALPATGATSAPPARPFGPLTIGYEPQGGFWIDFRQRYLLGVLLGDLFLKQVERTGFFWENRLTYEQPRWNLSLRGGRNEAIVEIEVDGTKKLVVIGQLVLTELVYTRKPEPLFGGPWQWSGSLAVGWFEETEFFKASVGTSRYEGAIQLRSGTLRLNPNLTMSAFADYRAAFYGTGGRQSILTTDFNLSRRIDSLTTLSLRHKVLDMHSAGPFRFDKKEPEHELALLLSHTFSAHRLTFELGYDFLDNDLDLEAGIRARLSPTFLIELKAKYDLLKSELSKLSAEMDARLSPSLRFLAKGEYDLSDRGFEDVRLKLEYGRGWWSAALQYEPVDQKVWLQLAAATDPREPGAFSSRECPLALPVRSRQGFTSPW